MATKIESSYKQNLIDLYQSGMTIKEVAAKFNRTTGSVYKLFTTAGITIRGKKIPLPDISEMIAIYQSGVSVTNMALKFNCSVAPIYRAFENAGFKPPARLDIDIASIVNDHAGGMSLKAMSDKYGVARHVISLRLKEAGIQIRGRSEAEYIKWNKIKTDRAAVERQCSAAWQAASDRIVTEDTKSRIAQTKYRRRLGIFKFEDRVADFLRLAGFSIKQQFPVGPYNLDISANELPIAVEIVHLGSADFNGRADTGNRPQHERLKYLLNLGWHVIYVIATGPAPHRCIDLTIVGDDLISAIKFASTDKSVFGKYRVIWGKGQPPPRAHYNFNGLPVVE